MRNFPAERDVPGLAGSALAALCTLYAPAASAVTGVNAPGDTTDAAFLRYLCVLLVAVSAWAASSLPVLAEWEGGGGRQRLRIAQGLLQAVFFGFMAFLASMGAGQSLMASYIAAASAAYMGERYFPMRPRNGENQADRFGREDRQREK